ncbi:phage tail tape measure protein [Rhodococcus erythropolis]|uniref:phage tail tape measure protein n=1 Tax=Rhodococcus erythropolis TaxID=1833 RepID=UPI0033BDAAB0
MAEGVKKSEAEVVSATKKLSAERDKAADSSNKVRIAELKLQELRDSGKAKASQIATAEAAVEKARRDNNKQAGAAEAAETQLTQARKRAADAAEAAANANDDLADSNDDVAGSADRAGGGLKGMFSGLDSGTKKLAGLAAGAAGVGGAMELMGKSMEQGKVGSKLAASFGESAEEAKRYGKVAGDLYAGGVGDSMDTIREAVSAVGGSFGSLDSMGAGRLEELTTKAAGFAEIFDQDVSGAVQSASLLMDNGLASSADEAFDMMTRGMQEVSVSMRDELPEILNEYGTNFRALGFDGKDAFNLLISASQGGAIALDKTGDALKEFTIRGADMSKSSVETFEAIGLSGEEMAAAIASGGEGAQAALQQTAQGLLEITDPAERANAAIALFGSPLEDLSVDKIPGFLAGLAGADDVMGDFTGSLDGSIDVLNDNAGSAFETFKRGLEQNVTNMLGDNVIPLLGNFTGALEENEGSALAAVAGMTGMGGAIAGFETAQGAFDSVKEGAIGLKDGFVSAKDTAVGMADSVKKGVAAVKDFDVASKLSSATTKIWSGIQLAFNVIMSANPLMLIVIGIGLLVAAVVLIATKTTWFQTIWDAVWGGITATWDWVWGKLQEGFAYLKDGFGAIGDKVTQVKDWIVGKWDELVGFITGLPGRIAAVASGMWQSVVDAAGGAKDWVVGKWDEMVGFITGLPGRIRDAASGMWDGIKDTFKGVLNWIIMKWNDFRISMKIPSSIPIIGGKGFTIDTPDLPLLASGGVAGRRKDGTLWGPGTPTSDSILAMDKWGMPTALVSTDEGVVNAEAMANGGSELVGALNAGWTPTAAELHTMFPDLPKYAGGGVLGGIQAGANQRKPVDVYRDWSMVPTTPQTPAPVNPEVFGGTNWTPPVQNAGGNGVQNTSASGASGVSGTSGASGTPVASGASSGGGGVGEPYGLPTGSSISYGSAGFPDWVTSLAGTYGLQPSTYPGHQESDRGEAGYAPNPDHLNRGIDWSGPIAAMQTYAEWLLSIAPRAQGLEQIIWQNPNTGQKIGWAGRSEDVSGSYFASDYSGHQDHVHTRTSASIGDVAADPEVSPTSPETSAPSTSGSPSVAGTTSTTTDSTSPPEKEKAFSARDRWRQMGSDIGGIWADAAVEITGVGEWLDLADRYTIKPGSSASSSSSTQTMSNAEADAAIAAGTTEPVDTVVRTGHDLYAYEIARAAKDMGLGEQAAVIGEATALVEVGDPLKMFANAGLPASLNLPHDAVGSNGSSTGLFQQQDFPEWGTLEQRMNPFESAKMFYEHFPLGWELMDPGMVAQSVQRSAFPAKYSQAMDRARELVDGASLFDTGGVWEPGTLGFNGLDEPELVLKDAHWKIAEANIDKVDELVGAGAPAGRGGPAVVQNFHTTLADQAGFQRQATRRLELSMMQHRGGSI